MSRLHIFCPNPGRRLRDARRAMSFLLAAAILTIGIGPAYGASRQAPDPAKIQAKVKKLGVGEHVFVKLADGTKLRGHIISIGDEAFTVKPDKRAETVEIAYVEVLKVRENPGPLTWMAIGAAIAIVVIVALR